jgi:hypothetical protein
MPKYIIDGDGKTLHDGDRVYRNDEVTNERLYGTIKEPEELELFPDIWVVKYDNGAESFVFNPEKIFKV